MRCGRCTIEVIWCKSYDLRIPHLLDFPSIHFIWQVKISDKKSHQYIELYHFIYLNSLLVSFDSTNILSSFDKDRQAGCDWCVDWQVSTKIVVFDKSWVTVYIYSIFVIQYSRMMSIDKNWVSVDTSEDNLTGSWMAATYEVLIELTAQAFWLWYLACKAAVVML